MACHVNHDVLAANLPRLPMEDPVFILSDGVRTLPRTLASGATLAMGSTFYTLAEAAEAAEVMLGGRPVGESQAHLLIAHAVCTGADVLLLNSYSPLSHALHARAVESASSAGRASPQTMHYTRKGSDSCLPLFRRIARFDILPNRYGILGQFGPDRKLQLLTTNLSAIVGWDGRLLANASIEMEVFVSNTSHVLHVFEYTKENNVKGVQFLIPQPPGGWRAATWHSFSIPIQDAYYYYPGLTPWDSMDRLELYYSSPSPKQRRGDYIRIRNVYVRSTHRALLACTCSPRRPLLPT